MSKLKIHTDKIAQDLIIHVPEFPKYTTQLMNLANRNAQGTRPKVVGNMSELIQEYPGTDFKDWEAWYNKQKPQAIDEATNRIIDMIEKFRSVMDKIDCNLVKKWVIDLVINKTFLGLRFQKSILKRIAYEKNTTYRTANAFEESKGIDGYIGDKPVSIKPITYRLEPNLKENIEVEIIYYDKKKDGIYVEYE
jgi:hypothetical protein